MKINQKILQPAHEEQNAQKNMKLGEFLLCLAF